MKLFDVVELVVDLPDEGPQAGAVGTIVDEYPDGEYEVEFTDPDGAIVVLLAVRPDQIRPST